MAKSGACGRAIPDFAALNPGYKVSGITMSIAMSRAGSQDTSTPAQSTPLVMMNARSLAAAIRARQISCVEVMNAYLDHIERINLQVTAIVALRDRDNLLAEAREKDAQLARGEATGPLHGLPFAVKDLFPVK